MATTYKTATEAVKAYVKANPTATRPMLLKWAREVGMNETTALTQYAKARKDLGLKGQNSRGKGYTF